MIGPRYTLARSVDGYAVHAVIVTGSAIVHVIETSAYHRVDGEPSTLLNQNFTLAVKLAERPGPTPA